jgi:hypothetical protein
MRHIHEFCVLCDIFTSSVFYATYSRVLCFMRHIHEFCVLHRTYKFDDFLFFICFGFIKLD